MSGRNSQTAKQVKRVQAPASDAARNDDDSEKKTVSVETAGRILGVSRASAYAYAKDGSIPTIKLGKRLLVPKVALDRLLMSA